jgi:hypothetical protein
MGPPRPSCAVAAKPKPHGRQDAPATNPTWPPGACKSRLPDGARGDGGVRWEVANRGGNGIRDELPSHTTTLGMPPT